MDSSITYWLEMAEVRVNDELYRIAAAQPGNSSGAALAPIGGGIATALTALDVGFFNRAIGLGVERPLTEQDLDDVVTFYDGLNRTTSVVQLAPHATPPEATEWLSARGFVPGRRWAKVWRPIDEPVEAHTSLRIEPIGVARRADFERVISSAFEFPALIASIASALIGRPGWTHYVGYDDADPVTAAAMRVIGGMAWLGYGSTVEAYRGRGGQSAMFAVRLRDAAELGCRYALTETGEDSVEAPNPSYRNMKRLGFRDAYLRQNWIRTVARVT